MSIIAEVLGIFLSYREKTEATNSVPLEDYHKRDVPGLKRIYHFVMAGAASGHVYSLLRLVPWQFFSASDPWSSSIDLARGGVYHWELLLISVSLVILCLVMSLELERVGLIGSSSWKNAWLFPVGCLFFGPGAMLMASWSSMDNTMVNWTSIEK